MADGSNKLRTVLIALVGFVWMLAVGGIGLGLYFYFSHRSPEKTADGQPNTPEQPSPAAPTVPGFGLLPSPAPEPARDPAKEPAAEPVRPSDPAPPVRPGDPQQVSRLIGAQGEIDRLEEPEQVPDGLLAFITGMNLMADFKMQEAIPFFDKAIQSDPRSSDYYAVRGSAYVLGLKVDQGLPDLRRAADMLEDPGPLKRLLRLAYLMKNDQNNAARYRLPLINRSEIDSMIEEIGAGITRPNDRQAYARALEKLQLFAKMIHATYWKAKYGAAINKVGIELLRSGANEQALRIFSTAVAQNPSNATFVYYYALALMGTGNYDLARRELTFVLCWKRFLPEAYAARAICAARHLDAARAEADLAMARKLDSAKAAQAEAALAEMRRLAPAESAAQAAQRLDELLSLARSHADFEALVQEALRIKRGVDPHRKRYEEWYQDTLLKKCLDARAHPGDAGRLAEIADFVWDNRDNYAVQLVSGGPTQYFRFGAKELEAQFADELATEGLRWNGGNSHCLAIAADYMLFKEKDLDGATRMAERSVDGNPPLPRACMALSNCYHEYKERLRGNARELRGARYATVRESDGHGNWRDVQRITPAPPADQAAADECDRQAAAYEAKEVACLDAAVAGAKGTPEELDYQAQVHYERKQYAEARACMEKAVRQFPDDFRFQMGLAKCLRLMGKTEEFNDVYQRALSMQETTALECLRVTFELIEAGNWDGARKMLLRAQATEPSNAIVTIYKGIVAELGARDPAEAEACYLAALAQEEARARANGFSLQPGATTGLLLNEADLTILLRLKLAKLRYAGHPAAAAELYLANVALEPRITATAMARAVGPGVFPNPLRKAEDVQYTALVTALKFNRLFAAQALSRTGRASEAAEHRQEGQNFLSRLASERYRFEQNELDPQFSILP